MMYVAILFLFKWSIESYGRLTRSLKHADLVVQKFDGTIHWLNGYPMDKCQQKPGASSWIAPSTFWTVEARLQLSILGKKSMLSSVFYRGSLTFKPLCLFHVIYVRSCTCNNIVFIVLSKAVTKMSICGVYAVSSEGIPSPPPLPLPRKMYLWRICFALLAVNCPLPAELKFWENIECYLKIK